MCDVADVRIITQVRPVHVEKLLIFIHPDLRHSYSVDPVRVFVIGETVRMKLSEDVPDSRTGNGLKSAATLPNSEALLNQIQF